VWQNGRMLLALALLLQSGSLPADAAVRATSQRWIDCLDRAVDAYSSLDELPDTIVVAAYGKCGTEESAFTDAVETSLAGKFDPATRIRQAQENAQSLRRKMREVETAKLLTKRLAQRSAKK
jgi:hypothetical protein